MALSYQNYTGDNATTQFSIPFTYQDTAEISVTVNGVAETGLTFPSSSTVLLTSAPATGTLVQVRRSTDLTARAVDFASGSVLTEEDLDDSAIQVFHAAQESADRSADAIALDTDNKWDAQGNVIKNVGTPIANDDAATKAYADGISSAAASAAVTAANAAVTAATGAIIPDATKIVLHPINTQYTLSDGITTDYSAKHYANVASTNAGLTAADLLLTNADVVSANAAVTAAESARDTALAAYDNFDDRYLGVFTTANEPLVDNDGDPLAAGMLYFNSTDSAMKVYTGSAWVAAYVSGAGYLAAANNLSELADPAVALTNLGVTATAAQLDYNIVTTLGDVQPSKTVTSNSNEEVRFNDNGSIKFGTGNDVSLGFDASSGNFIISGSPVSFGKAAIGSTIGMSGSGNQTFDFSLYQNFVFTLTGDITLVNPTTEQIGQSGFFVFIQDATGNRTVSIDTNYKTAGGLGLLLSADPDAVDIVPYVVQDTNNILLGTPQIAFT